MSGYDEFLNDFTDQWDHAWNSHDHNLIMSLFAEDFVFDDQTFWPNTISTREEMKSYLEKVFSVMHDVQFEELGRFFDPSACRGIFLFMQSGSPPPSAPQENKFRTHGCDIFLGFKDGKLSNYLASYEITEMMRQMKMLPPRNGKIGGAYLLSLQKDRVGTRA